MPVVVRQYCTYSTVIGSIQQIEDIIEINKI